MIRISYLGKRFPRNVTLQGGKRTSFLEDRRVIEIPDYDAYLLLKLNTRIQPEVWEFNVVGVSIKEVIPTPPAAPEVAKEAPKNEEITDDKQKTAKIKKGKGK